MLNRPTRSAIVALLAILSGCSKSEADPAPKATLTVAPATADVTPNATPLTFTASLTHSTAAIAWSIVQGTCTVAGSVDPLSGDYTPPATNDAPCTLKVRATAGELTADATVNLGARYLRVTPSNPSVTPGDAPFGFTVEQAGLTGATTWSVVDGTCAAGTYGAFDAGTGLYTPPAANAAACSFGVTATVDGLSASSTPSVLASAGGGGSAGDGLRELMDAFGALLLECSGAPWQAPAEIDASVAQVQAAVDAGRLTYDPTTKGTCFESIASATCLDLFHGANPASCIFDVLPGTLANGAGCSDSQECAAGYCDFAAATCPGTCTAFVALDGACSHGEACAASLACDGVRCVAPTTVAAGSACDGEVRVCAAGSACGFDPKTWTNVCLPIGSLGDACVNFQGCAPALLCDVMATGTCLDLAPRGASCAAAACNPILDFCSPATSTCTAIPTLGQSCAESGSCAGDSYCDAMGSGTCVALPGPGEDCTVTMSMSGPSCSGTAHCAYDPVAHTATCVAPITAGGTCTSNGTCIAGYYCDAVRPSPGSCVVQKGPGSTCADHWDCQEGLECLGGLCMIDTCY